ncbi:unnamed protein product [Ceratitis capitata]|uniref:(Mediterranean fruit fly) hypothetical protein n=1 Tax=Ceratitis capitata TaxID=7213 RepID=A0A811VD92_CERCA|nr:unnamed protein product [Ceratitis capitata]
MKDVEPAPRYHSIKDLPAYTLESPRQPAAQSTAPTIPTDETTGHQYCAPNKPCTEQSMLMNELALKLLPEEQNDVKEQLTPTITIDAGYMSAPTATRKITISTTTTATSFPCVSAPHSPMLDLEKHTATTKLI